MGIHEDVVQASLVALLSCAASVGKLLLFSNFTDNNLVLVYTSKRLKWIANQEVPAREHCFEARRIAGETF